MGKQYNYHIVFIIRVLHNGSSTTQARDCCVSEDYDLLTPSGIDEIKEHLYKSVPDALRGSLVILNIIPLNENKENT